mgnify:CR=1 FL=1
MFRTLPPGASVVPLPPVARPAWNTSSVSCRPLSGSSTHLLIRDDLSDARVARLDQRGGPLHGDRLRELSSCSVTFKRRVRVHLQHDAGLDELRNPCSSASNRYGPIGRFCRT